MIRPIEEVYRKADRLKWILPILLKDAGSRVTIKGVILDISAKGVRLLSNDRRLLITKPEVLIEKTFTLEFDFFGIDTKNIEGEIKYLRPGKHPEFERQLGIEFTKIATAAAREINRKVSAMEAANKS